MKFITILALIIFFLSIISCSLRRIKSKNNSKRKSKSKTGLWYENSDLDSHIWDIAQKMCLKIGKTGTFVFFNNIKNYLNGNIADRLQYDKLFQDTFTYPDNAKDIDPNTIQQKMLKTVGAAVGGFGNGQIPDYWQAYSDQMQQANGQYLNGLIQAASKKVKLHEVNERISAAQDRRENLQELRDLGTKISQEGSKKALGEYISGKGISDVISGEDAMRWLNHIALSITQTIIMKGANSAIFSDHGLDSNLKGFKKALIEAHGRCGGPRPDTEDAKEGLHSPYFRGNMTVLE